jgi:putative MATE family efflux protein
VTAPPARKLTLFALTWPIFVEQGLHVLIGTVDTLMVSHLSDDAVAALGQAGQVIFLAVVLFGFVGMGSSVVITHHLGAGDRAGADRIAAAAIGVNSWIGLLASLLVFAFSAPMLRLLQLPPGLLPLAMQFLPLMGGTLFLEAQNIAMGAVLRAHGHTRDPMWVTGLQNLLNAAGNCLLLFGLLGFPRLGVTGVALSGVASRVVAFAALRLLLRRRLGLRMPARAYLSFPLRDVGRILQIGGPAAGETLCWATAFMAVSTVVARMGSAELAVLTYTMQISMWVVVFGISVGLGTEVLVGHLVGAGAFEEAYQALLRSLRAGVLLVVGAVALTALFAPWIMRAFTHDPAIAAAGVVLLRIGLVLEPGRVFNVVVISSLRATGDARFPFRAGLVSMWGIWVFLSWLLGLRLGLGLIGVWIAMTLDEWLRGGLMYWRWRRRRWLKYAVRSREAMNQA